MAQREGKPSRRGGGDKGVLPSRARVVRSCMLVAIVGFGVLWLLVLWLAHSSLLLEHPSWAGIGPQRLSLQSLQVMSRQNNNMAPPMGRLEASLQQQHPQQPDNPHYGWQPDSSEETSCSWRDCFKNSHNCPTCRDSVEDLGIAPEAPLDWVPDVTMLHNMMLNGKDSEGRPWPPSLPDELCEDIGVQGGKMDGNKLLLNKVPISIHPTLPSDNSPKIMCMVYTMEVNHATNIRAMRETWAPYCDGFLAFSTVSDPRIPAISLTHDGPEEYNNMWQKVRSIWKFVGTHYLEDFDFFFQGGEDLFVIPQNLKRYLQQLLEDDGKTSEDDYFVGRRFKGYGKDNYFNSGGAGYALSRGTLRKYINEGWSHPKCSPSRHTAMEDVMIAECLRKAFDIDLTDTRDSELRERFHPFAPQAHDQWRPPAEGNKDWYFDYNQEWPPLLGEKCCAPDSVSFHYIKKPAMVRHLYALLNKC